MAQPAPVKKIITNVADAVNVRPADVIKPVQDTLRAGVRYGYIQRAYNKLYTLPSKIRCDDDTSSSAESSESNDNSAGDGALCRRRGDKKRRGGRNRRNCSLSRGNSRRNRTRCNSRRSH